MRWAGLWCIVIIMRWAGLYVSPTHCLLLLLKCGYQTVQLLGLGASGPLISLDKLWVQRIWTRLGKVSVVATEWPSFPERKSWGRCNIYMRSSADTMIQSHSLVRLTTIYAYKLNWRSYKKKFWRFEINHQPARQQSKLDQLKSLQLDKCLIPNTMLRLKTSRDNCSSLA